MLTNILYILLAIVILMILITVHELGHFIAGKVLGFKINEFAIGFGKAIYKRTNKKTGEVFSIRILPLGGYCAFEGEDEENPSKDAFNNQKPWKRIIVLVSGVLFNFMFGVLMSVVFLLVNGNPLPKISAVEPMGANYSVLQKGDIVRKVNGKSIEIYRSLQSLTSKIDAGEDIVLQISRNGEIQDVVVKKYEHRAFYYVSLESGYELYTAPNTKADIDAFKAEVMSFTVTKDADNNYAELSLATKYYKDAACENEYTIDELKSAAGITLAKEGVSLGVVLGSEFVKYGFFEAVLKAWPFCFYICGLILSALGGLFTGKTAIKELGGTITAVSQMAEISKISFSSFLMLFPLLSMNLALFNILPIPALDGFHVLFVLIEWIIGRPINRKVEAYINTIGLFVLLGLVIFLDVYHFFFACRLLL